MVWWADFQVGERSEMGSHAFTEAEILAFGRLKPVRAGDTGWGMFGRRSG